MYYISHRGNIDGINKKLENNLKYIIFTFKIRFQTKITLKLKKYQFYVS